MGLIHVTDDNGSVALADLLNGNRRRRPVVVVTSPAGRRAPYIDAERIWDEVGDLADVYVIASGAHTWTFSTKMPDLTQVYGGAGRVYPVGHEWVSNPYASPLHFAYNAKEGERATRDLASDALRMAAAAGLIQRSRSRHRIRVTAEVVGIPVPERAIVKFDGRFAPIAQELTVPDVPLDRVLRVGLQVAGWFDPEARRVDIGDALLSPVDALHSYTAGEVVLTEVGSVQQDRAELKLHPAVSVDVTRDDVTGNDLDDLRTLMTPGEVVPARVTATAPDWRLSLLDVDDEEVPRTAAALLDGGPPWLQPPPAEETLGDWTAEDPGLGLAVLPAEAAPPGAELAGRQLMSPASAPAPPSASSPTPMLLDKKRPPATRPGTPAAATGSMALTIDALRAQVVSLECDLKAVREELREGSAERAALDGLRLGLERQVAQLEHALRVQRSRLRKAKRPGQVADQAGPEFADPEQGFRYAVVTAWASRTPLGEQADRPLSEYDIGPDFLASLNEVPGISLEKVAGVVVEIVTARAQELAGRDLHQLRESAGPTARYVRRASDGATCWRAALQVHAPQARRIHYWVLPGGRVELSRVALHDDFQP